VTPATLSWSLLQGNPETAVQCRQGGHQIDRLRSEQELNRPLDSRTTGGGQADRGRASLARDERGAEVIETVLLLGMIVCACMFCITALDKKIVGRWNAIGNVFGAV
jgi:Flp pilus assembly pilin Flp